MGENKFRILEKTSPLLLNSFVLHFFKPLNSYLSCSISVGAGLKPAPTSQKGRGTRTISTREVDSRISLPAVRRLAHSGSL